MPRKSTHALEKSAKPYSQITDRKNVKTPGQANVPTKRQKTRMATLATSVIGGVYGKSIAMLAKNLGRPLVDKALNKPMINYLAKVLGPEAFKQRFGSEISMTAPQFNTKFRNPYYGGY